MSQTEVSNHPYGGVGKNTRITTTSNPSSIFPTTRLEELERKHDETPSPEDKENNPACISNTYPKEEETIFTTTSNQSSILPATRLEELERGC